MLNINIHNIGNALVGFDSNVNKELSLKIQADSRNVSKKRVGLVKKISFSTRSKYPRRRYWNKIKREYDGDKYF